MGPCGIEGGAGTMTVRAYNTRQDTKVDGNDVAWQDTTVDGDDVASRANGIFIKRQQLGGEE